MEIELLKEQISEKINIIMRLNKNIAMLKVSLGLIPPNEVHYPIEFDADDINHIVVKNAKGIHNGILLIGHDDENLPVFLGEITQWKDKTTSYSIISNFIVENRIVNLLNNFTYDSIFITTNIAFSKVEPYIYNLIELCNQKNIKLYVPRIKTDPEFFKNHIKKLIDELDEVDTVEQQPDQFKYDNYKCITCKKIIKK